MTTPSSNISLAEKQAASIVNLLGAYREYKTEKTVTVSVKNQKYQQFFPSLEKDILSKLTKYDEYFYQSTNGSNNKTKLNDVTDETYKLYQGLETEFRETARKAQEVAVAVLETEQPTKSSEETVTIKEPTTELVVTPNPQSRSNWKNAGITAAITSAAAFGGVIALRRADKLPDSISPYLDGASVFLAKGSGAVAGIGITLPLDQVSDTASKVLGKGAEVVSSVVESVKSSDTFAKGSEILSSVATKLSELSKEKAALIGADALVGILGAIVIARKFARKADPATTQTLITSQPKEEDSKVDNVKAN